MRILIVDDIEERHAWFAGLYPFAERIHAHTATKALADLKAMDFDLVHLDHDLHLAHPVDKPYDPVVHSGQAVVRALIEDPRRPRVIVHSQNPDAIRWMYDTLLMAGFNVTAEPAFWQNDRAMASVLLSIAFPGRKMPGPWEH